MSVRRLAGLAMLMATILTGQQRILVHGHRGARAMRPENTIPAFEYAIAAGVDVLELDMAVTKDNVLVVSHDPVLHAPVCKGPQPSALIHELTLAQVKEWDCGAVQNPGFPKQQAIAGTRIPTLEEVFVMASKIKVEFNIETKIFRDKPEYSTTPEKFAELVLAMVKKHKLEKRVIVQSFDFRTLVVMKRLAPEIRRSALLEGTNKRDFVSACKEAGDAQIVSPHWSLVTPENVAAAHAAGIQVVPWTANQPEQWEKLALAKVDAIISDDPAALIAWLKGK